MRLNSPQKSVLLLAAGFVACVAMLLLRAVLFGRWFRGFLAWNLFLAVVPLGIAALSLAWERRRKSRLALLPLAGLSFLWLVFFPNSPYLFTDFIHLIERGLFIPDANARGMANMKIWYDIINSSLFAFVGHLVGLASLYIMQNLWTKQFGRWTAWVFVVLSCLAAGYGVFLGRFGRWNSWHLFTHTDEVWSTLSAGMFDSDALLFSLSFSAFIAVSYLFVYVFKKQLFVSKELR